MLHLARAAEPPTGLPLQIQAFSLGRELAIVGLSHEPFGEYQRFLQHESPFPHTLVFGYYQRLRELCADGRRLLPAGL